MEAAEEVATEAAVAAADTAEEEVAVVVDMEVAAGEEATAAVAVAEIAAAGVVIAAATGINFKLDFRVSYWRRSIKNAPPLSFAPKRRRWPRKTQKRS